VRRLKNLVPRPVRKRIAAVRRWHITRPATTRKRKEEILASGRLPAADLELLRRVDSRISIRDGMFGVDAEHYYKVGLSAVHCVDEALRRAGASEPASILDLPCGHGRVMRTLAARFPGARLTACELDRDGVDFCASTFGASGVYSVPDFDRLEIGGSFDLLWCGSLVTHLDASRIQAFLRFTARHLAPGGIAMITTHGDYVANRMPTGEFDYDLDPDQVERIVAAYRRDGLGYEDYVHTPEYGISLTSPAWVRGEAERVGGLEEVYFAPRGWDRHQDVFAFRKRA
jgi:SAM-dependent methyltransferase